MKLDPDLPFSSMSVRDYIAMHAMAGLLSCSATANGAFKSVEDLAMYAVGNADVLIAELQKTAREPERGND